MNKFIKTGLAGCLLALLLLTAPMAAESMASPAGAEEFKIVGYYSGSLFNEPVEKLPTDKLTHVIYAFLIPNGDGSLKPLAKPEQLAAVLEQAHQDGAKVYIALGGWSYENQPLAPVFEQIAADDTLRGLLVHNVVEFVKLNALDGVEIDWEHPNAQTIGAYEKLVRELAAALKSEGKALSAAVNGAWSATQGPEVSMLMTAQCLENFEFINVMGYDINDSDHSPLWFSQTSIDYWLQRGVAPEKIVLGMPLYARPSWLQYRELVELDSNNAYQDYAATQPLESHYNGLNTLREKTLLALNKAGGVMLFDVNEDVDPHDEALAPYNVVNMITATVNEYRPVYNPDAHHTGPVQRPYLQSLRLYIDGAEIKFASEDGLGVPFISADTNRALVPLRKPLEAIGASVGFEGESQTVIVEKDGLTISIVIGGPMYVNQSRYWGLEQSAIIIDDRTYMPVRGVFEALGYAVSWEQSTQSIYIVSQDLD